MDPKFPLGYFWLGRIYTSQGRYADADRASIFRYLDAAYREHSHWLVWLKRDPRWDEIRADPRFENLVKKVGLPS